MLFQNLGGQRNSIMVFSVSGNWISRSAITCRLDVRGLNLGSVTSDVIFSLAQNFSVEMHLIIDTKHEFQV